MIPELTEQEKNQLRKFVELASLLKEMTLLKKGTPKIALYIGDGGQRTILSDIDPFRSMVLSLRVFTLDRENVFFYKICRIVARELKRKEDNNKIKQLHKIRNKYKNFPWTFKLIVGESSPEKIIDLFFNTTPYFHNDEEKEERLNQLKDEYGDARLDFGFEAIIYRYIGCISDLKDLIETELELPIE